MSFKSCVYACLSMLLFVQASRADAPAVTTVFPTGVQAGHSVLVRLGGKVGSAAPSVWCSRDDVTFTPGEVPAEFTAAAGSDAPQGIAWVRFYNADGATDLRPFWIGQLPEIQEWEVNNSTSQAQRIDALPVTVNGVLHQRGEVDTFAVALNEGQPLVASIDANRLLGSPMDGILQLVSPEGFVITQNDDDHGFDPLIEFVAPKTGIYFVRVFAFPANPDSSIGYIGGESYIYRLSLTSDVVVDHAVPHAINGAAPAPLQVQGWRVPDNAATLTPHLDNGELALALPGYSLLLPHRLPIVCVPLALEAPPMEGQAAQELSAPVALTGHISQPGEVDVYRFKGTKDRELRFTVDARKFDSPVDPMLRLLAPDGKVIKDQDDEGRRELDLSFVEKLSEEGEYRLEVRDRFGNGGSRYVYVLSITEPAPDFAITAAANQFVLKPDAPLEIDLEINRSDGFKEEITFSLEGLPEDNGVTIAETKSAGEGETAKKVKMKLESTGVPFSGPVRLVGKAGERSRPAEAPIANVTDRTNRLWLTVLKKPAEGTTDK